MTISLLSLVAAAVAPAADPIQITVDLSRPTAPIPASLYGIFFEEINQAGDGGLYAELVRNRGMEGAAAARLPAGWRATEGLGQIVVDAANPLNAARTHSLRIERTSSETPFGAVNEGFWGIPVRRNAEYRLTLWVRGDAPVDVSLEDDSRSLATARIEAPGTGWRRVERTLRGAGDADKARLKIAPAKAGTVWVAYASLMPRETWKGRSNGLRRDLAQHVDAMRPNFVRFPGGCFVEGGDRLADRFDWKRSVGPLHERGGLDRSMWGYPSTFGLGYHEYLQWCEDLGADAMFVANCGMSHRETVPMDQMGPYVQDVLDAIEYANGPVTSKWGALRAKNGHPKPFNLKYVEIGNENGGPAYNERYALIANAIGERYPNVQRIACLWGGYPRNAPVDLLDEHYYFDPAWFWNNANRYDGYDRKGPKIYVGEYAVTRGCGQGNLDAALAEAAFMAGMERNSDIVRLASYAPLFVNVNNRQWNPNAIVFDANRSYGTPSYHVQALFANHRPDRGVTTRYTVPAPEAYHVAGGVGLQTWRTQAEFRDLRVEVDGRDVTPANPEWRTVRGAWRPEVGTVAQSQLGEDARAILKGVDLAGANRYTVRVKARKTGGNEGFILMFQNRDDDNFLMWNVGGWGNTMHGFERGVGGARSVVGNQVQGAVETGRWYDLRIEGDGPHVRAYLDDKLVQELDDRATPRFTTVAGVDRRTNELVIKAINGTEGALTAQIETLGGNVGSTAKGFVLTGDRLDAENSFVSPTRIAPRPLTLSGFSNRTRVTFAPRSVTILRVPLRRR
jgi:alpha-L-arabinofuranosidase